MKPLFNKLFRKTRSFSRRADIFIKDFRNKLTYGLDAPLYMELIWVDPSEITTALGKNEVLEATGMQRNKASGVVVDWNNVASPYPLSDEFRIRYCHDHWVEGKSWQELGVFEHMQQTRKYGSWPLTKIKERFEMLDRAYDETKQLGRLKTRKEMEPDNFREKDGILIHIDDQGKPVFGGNGFHRLAISKALQLSKIPACIGMVDKGAVEYLKRYRRNRIENN